MRFLVPLVLLIGLSACAAPAPDLECRTATYLPYDLTLDQGDLRPDHYADAVRDLRRRALYDAQAEYLLGLVYENGIGVEQDRKAAASLYLKAAKAGDTKAQFRLATMIWEGVDWSSTDYERYRARDIFRYLAADLATLAQDGDAEAQYMLGYLYGTGKGFPIDTWESLKWYRKAAEQGHGAAQYRVGYYYKGNRKDEAQALKWFRRAAENGYAEAQFYLGEAYRWGVLGVTPDKVEAMTWYSLAAANDHAGAVYARDELAKKLTAAERAAAQQRLARTCVSSPEGA